MAVVQPPLGIPLRRAEMQTCVSDGEERRRRPELNLWCRGRREGVQGLSRGELLWRGDSSDPSKLEGETKAVGLNPVCGFAADPCCSRGGQEDGVGRRDLEESGEEREAANAA